MNQRVHGSETSLDSINIPPKKRSLLSRLFSKKKKRSKYIVPSQRSPMSIPHWTSTSTTPSFPKSPTRSLTRNSSISSIVSTVSTFSSIREVEKMKQNKLLSFVVVWMSPEKLFWFGQLSLLIGVVYNLLVVFYVIGFERERNIVVVCCDVFVDLLFWVNLGVQVIFKEKLFRCNRKNRIVNTNKKKARLRTWLRNLFARRKKKGKGDRRKRTWLRSLFDRRKISSFKRRRTGRKLSKFNQLISSREAEKKNSFWKKLNYVFIRKLLIIEVIALFPLEWCLMSPWGRLIRLLSAYKIKDYKNSIPKLVSEKILSPVLFRIVSSFALLVLVTHMFTCSWFFLARLDSKYNNFIVPSNVKEPLLYGCLLSKNELSQSFLSRFKQYLVSMFFASTYMVGYNNPIPQNAAQSIFSVLIVLCGAIFFVIIVGTVSSLLRNINKAGQEFDDQISKLESYFKYKNVNKKLRKDIKDYFRALRKSGSIRSDRLFSDLDISVKKRISVFQKRDHVLKHSTFFKDCKDKFFIEDICLHLKYLLLLQGYTLIEQGKIGSEMYILLKGRVEIFVNGVSVKILDEGKVFGEIALLNPVPRTATIISKDICEVFVLEKKHFKQILESYPEYRSYFEKLAKERMQENRMKKKE